MNVVKEQLGQLPKGVSVYVCDSVYAIVHPDIIDGPRMVAIHEIQIMLHETTVHVIKESDWNRSPNAYISYIREKAVKL